MTRSLPKLSICIPAYNRAEHLPALLDSIITQNYSNVEIVISEDNSPQRQLLGQIVQEYRQRGIDYIHYFENEKTLGFDGNLRTLFARATGDFCVMMGNDDLLCPGALPTIGRLLAEYPGVTVVVRSYGWFHHDPAVIEQTVNYFPSTRIFAAGEDTAVTFFRRVAVLAGLVFRREDAVALASDRFDGTLFYQIYLAAELLLRGQALYIAELIALCREGKPDFGQSQSEKGIFEPGTYTSDARIAMIKGMLTIATHMDAVHHGNFYKKVLRDLGNYSYYFLAYHANATFSHFWKYYRILGKLGFDRNPLFHFYFFSLAALGKNGCERIVKLLRSFLKATPRIGNIAAGTTVKQPTNQGREL